jgi:hypothetical protein
MHSNAHIFLIRRRRAKKTTGRTREAAAQLTALMADGAYCGQPLVAP